MKLVCVFSFHLIFSDHSSYSTCHRETDPDESSWTRPGPDAPDLSSLSQDRTKVHTSYCHAMTCVTVMKIRTSAKNMQAATVMTSLPQGLQDYLLRTSLWIAHAQATGSLMPQTLVVSIPMTVTFHLLEMTALAVFHKEVITLIMILLTKVLAFLMTLAVVLGQQNVLNIPRPSMGGSIPSAPGRLTPRIKVQVDQRL